MFSRWIVTNITSASVTTFLAFLAGIISWSVYCSVSTVTVKDPNPFRVSNRTASYLGALNCMSPFLRLRSVHTCIIVASICTFKGRVQVELHRAQQRYYTTHQELNYWGREFVLNRPNTIAVLGSLIAHRSSFIS
jgi:hypothetical protein